MISKVDKDNGFISLAITRINPDAEFVIRNNDIDEKNGLKIQHLFLNQIYKLKLMNLAQSMILRIILEIDL